MEITEIGDMVHAGAVAISDDGLPVQNGQVLRCAIEYAKKFKIPVINHAEDIHLRNAGVMNESVLSTKLGLPGNPDISESVMVFRVLFCISVSVTALAIDVTTGTTTEFPNCL